MNTLASIIQMILLSCLPQIATATPDYGTSVFDYWTQKDVNEITLHLDLDELEANRMTTESMNGTFVAGGQRYGVEMEVRGRFRRRTCAMPPMKLHLDKQGLREFGFNKHNDFKLVTHCTDDEAGQQAILKEELSYELYRQLFPKASFRTRLVTVNYVDTKDGATTTSYGILIEDNNEMEDRLGGKMCKGCYNIPAEQITNEVEVSLFQYMIGNADYSLVMQRNVKMIEQADGKYVTVPYDFDFSGVVNAAYSKPNTSIGQRKITDRIWMWEYAEAVDMKEARRTFLDQKDTVLETVAGFDHLSEDSKKEITKYLKGFYRELRAGTIGLPVVSR